MSLYNMLFGNNQHTPLLKAMLELDTVWPTGRYRDIYIEDEHIVLHTRNGGGNRECYCASEDHYCLVEVNTNLTKHPNYIYDEDDEFDCTYANFYFTVPDKFKEIVAAMKNNDQTPAEKWKELLERLEE